MLPEHKIDYDTALNLLEKAVADKGEDYRYTIQGCFSHSVYKDRDLWEQLTHLYPERIDRECKYFEQEFEEYGMQEPACIVGHAFSYIGITYEDVEDANVDGIHLMKSIPMTESARNLWLEAQKFQDEGFPWGEAIKRAVELVPKPTLEVNDEDI